MTLPKLLPIVAATTAALAVAAALGGAIVVYGGLYDVAATQPHTQPVHSLLEVAMRRSVRWRAREIAEPPLADERMAVRGAACYQDKCVQCHGAPGVAQGDIGKGMQPLPGPLVDARQHWRPRELYWLVRHGLKMTGMPAWEYRLTDAQIWELVAFLDRLPDLGATEYAQWQERARGHGSVAAACGRPTDAPAPVAGTAVLRGRHAVHQYACTACHSIPGVTGPQAFTGPPLDRFAGRGLIAGALPNTPENLARWLTHTQEVKPGTAMPQMGVLPQDARDIAAFLATLH
jgi:cytochrome c1